MAAALELFGCLNCGALQRLPYASHAGAIRCVACGSVLERTIWRSPAAALACACAGLLLLLPANFGMFVSTSVLGASRDSRLVSGALAMQNDGWPLLAALIFLFVVVAPFAQFGLLSAVLGALQGGLRPQWLGRMFRYADRLETWSMPDVFLLGLAVAYARLKASIDVQLGVGALAFIGVGLLSLLIRATLDKVAVWQEIRPQAPLPPKTDAIISCTGCAWLTPAGNAGAPCPRCAATLQARRPESIGLTAAFGIAALLFYVPANVMPMATLPIGFTPVSYTVLQGVIDLANAHLFALALVVFSASFAGPFLKLALIGWCLGSVWRRSNRSLRAKTRLYEVVAKIGRWSMIDPFAIACFVPVMQYNAFIYARAGPAATHFALVVVLTILATDAFDPRLIWDAAMRSHGAPE
jgi:paraquat-inducible protein A